MLVLRAIVAGMALTLATAGVQAASKAELQRAADQCFGKTAADWPALASACTTILKAKISTDARAGAHYNRGSAYLRLGGGKNALEDFNAALKLRPDFARALQSRAGILIGQNKLDLALADLNKAIALDPKASAAYSNRGLVYASKKDFGRAIADLTKAIELEPGDAKGYAVRGSAYLAKGDKDTALRDLNKAVELDPKLAVAYFNRGMLYASKGDKGKAKTDLQAVLSIDASNQQAKDELAKLEKAGG
jgi:tetratricopeptide (TPR) repeat protein